jgi:DNA ligase D-like protein (predicted 3'-phosphoesterase)
MSLKEYQSKRHFNKTPEPRGAVSSALGHKPRFVVQEHRASHLHWDFRLELPARLKKTSRSEGPARWKNTNRSEGPARWKNTNRSEGPARLKKTSRSEGPARLGGGESVLKSWAVPKGIPVKEGIKHLAVQVEDHPVSYINFHGTIPEGQYGAGTVKIWDKGTFKLIEQTAKTIKVELKGKKLKGVYVLYNFGSTIRQAHGAEQSRSTKLTTGGSTIRQAHGAEQSRSTGSPHNRNSKNWLIFKTQH